MQTPAEKGNALQEAVHAIEEHILRTSPALKEKSFLFEDKKVICVGGVHHEIDIYVTVDAAPGYRAVFIFECKNWKEAVGKNEVINFSEKIEAVQATRGYFIAKSFTKDAKNQAKKDPRMELLVATEHDPTGIPVPNELHMMEIDPKHLEPRLRARNRTQGKIETFNPNTIRAELKGKPISLWEYLCAWADEAMRQDSAKIRSHRMTPGKYDREIEVARTFELGELVLDGKDMEDATMNMIYQVTIHRPPVMSYFEIESRGRVVALAPVFARGAEFQMKVVSIGGDEAAATLSMTPKSAGKS